MGRATKRSTQRGATKPGYYPDKYMPPDLVWAKSGGRSARWSNTLVLGTSAKELLMLIWKKKKRKTSQKKPPEVAANQFPPNELASKDYTLSGYFSFFRLLAFGFWRAERISANEVGIEMETEPPRATPTKNWAGKMAACKCFQVQWGSYGNCQPQSRSILHGGYCGVIISEICVQLWKEKGLKASQ